MVMSTIWRQVLKEYLNIKKRLYCRKVTLILKLAGDSCVRYENMYVSSDYNCDLYVRFETAHNVSNPFSSPSLKVL